ncbi:MAG: molybdenum cofactor biosynthesis protein MoaE [Phycisphaerales bacterium]|nr:molybdenum cofactor biosynthesis protein MoaE [Phycisphaerales bacterium]
MAFGSAADALGWSERPLEWAGQPTVGALLDHLASSSPRLSAALSRLRVAVNERYAAPDQPICDGDEVAIIPPVSGGSESSARLTRSEIDVPALVAEVSHDDCGAIATFIGTVRAETRSDGTPLRALEYSAHEPMALSMMEDICRRTRTEYNLHKAVVVHRLGVVPLGQASIVIVISAGHRAECLDGCRRVIEAVKADAPIFKQELWGDDRRSWVDGI